MLVCPVIFVSHAACLQHIMVVLVIAWTVLVLLYIMTCVCTVDRAVIIMIIIANISYYYCYYY